MAHLTEGPLDGDLVPVELIDRRLPPQFLTLPAPVLHEDTELFDWTDARYARAPIHKTRHDPDEPWRYVWWDRPMTIRMP